MGKGEKREGKECQLIIQVTLSTFESIHFHLLSPSTCSCKCLMTIVTKLLDKKLFNNTMSQCMHDITSNIHNTL